MNKTINQLDEISSVDLNDESIVYDISESDTKKMSMQKVFNSVHKLNEKASADGNDEIPLFDSVANVTKKIKRNDFLSDVQPPIIASSTTFSGPAVTDVLYLKVVFTSAISASDAVTPLEITYNGDSVPVKVMKAGVASDIFAHEISSGVYSYLQSMTSFEMVYEDTNGYFVIVGNPIVLSSTDYTIYADGNFEQLKYSTSEVWTGKYWKNGKKIYSCGFQTTYTSGQININNTVPISASTVEDILDQFGSINKNTLKRAVGSVDVGAYVTLYINNNVWYQICSSSGDWNGSTIDYEIFYTKTTD
jgi:hypothetical protein